MEILVIAVVALIVFGPEKLPEMARKVGNFARDVRRMSEDVRSEAQGIMHDDDDDDPFFPEDEKSTKASRADEAAESKKTDDGKVDARPASERKATAPDSSDPEKTEAP